MSVLRKGDIDMKRGMQFVIEMLLICWFLSSCAPSQVEKGATSTNGVRANITAQMTIAPSATVSLTSNPTAIPTSTPTYTLAPSSTPTITPTAAPPTISPENAAQLVLLDTLTGFQDIDGIIISTEGMAVMQVLNDQSITQTMIQPHTTLAEYGQESWYFASPAFSPDGKVFVSQDKDTNGYGLNVWEVREDLRLRPLVRNISGYTMRGWKFSFAPDGEYLVSISIQNMILTMPDNWRQCAPHCDVAISYKPIHGSTYQLPEGYLVSKLDISNDDASYFAKFSPDDEYLATNSIKDDSVNWWTYIELWKVSDGKLYRKLEPIPSKYLDGERVNLDFSSNGEDLAFIGGGKLQNWQWEQDAMLWSVDGLFSSLDFSPDGTLLATGAPDGSIQLWRASDGMALATLRGHSHLITYIAFSPNGRLLASLDESGKLALWSIPR
jgi:WD40 repeat protein